MTQLPKEYLGKKLSYDSSKGSCSPCKLQLPHYNNSSRDSNLLVGQCNHRGLLLLLFLLQLLLTTILPTPL